jgi:hypothetical protein
LLLERSDIKFDAHHFADIERLAIVGETKWEQWMANFCKPFTKAKIKYFDISQQDAAEAWLRGSEHSREAAAAETPVSTHATVPALEKNTVSPSTHLTSGR